MDLGEIVSYCKRRGLIFPSSEIYGGLNGFWDYGPLGVELRKAIKDAWWRAVVQDNENVVGMDGSIIMHPRVWEASGHVEGFHDPMVDCKKCRARFRADQLATSQCLEKPSKSPLECGAELTEPRQFNLMFKTHVGATEDSGALAYLRPETAQAIFADYKTIQNVSRQKIPFGIAQIGKAFRNEVNPRNFIFRSREFEQMEMQYFVHPDSSPQHFEEWLARRRAYYKDVLRIPDAKLRLHQHGPGELAHYAKNAFDIEYEFPFGWQEVEGIHDRGTYDLGRHSQYSGKPIEYFDEESKQRFTPGVVEVSAGVDRGLLMLLCAHLEEEKLEVPEGVKDGDESRTVLRLPPWLAPVQAAVFPLQKKLAEPARKLAADLRREFRVQYDDAGAIGRRYRRQDEVGTPFCLTLDFETEGDGAVTVRERDSMRQERIALTQVSGWLRERLVR